MKYKHCHGSIAYKNKVVDAIRNHRVAETQRVAQQGLGNPIISTEFAGQRLVAVKNRLLHSAGWKTFHDFLFDYIKMALGSDWGTAETKKPLSDRHPLLVWYQKVCEFQKNNRAGPPGTLSTAEANGAISAYLHLAYALFALDHNAELQDKLLARLRNHDQFWGARYEVHVAAIFIRAGFTIEFEDESDRSHSHVEFTATHKRTGKQFSVEAKRREGKKLKIVRLFNNALRKHANHDRVIFIDINWPNMIGPEGSPPYLINAQRRLRQVEAEAHSNTPPAFVFVTNTPWEHHLDEPSPPSAAIIEGFLIPDFKPEAPSLRHAIVAREKHIAIFELIRSLQEHSSVPSTFDGEIPEFAFGLADPSQRIKIGSRFSIPDGATGASRIGTVTTANVIEGQKIAFCGISFSDGTNGIYTVPLSDAEISAWKRHPDTFFGEVGQKQKGLDMPLDVYDFFHGSYRATPKEKLLEFMKDSPDIAHLGTLDQPALASIYSERMTYSLYAQTGKSLQVDQSTIRKR